MSVYSPPKLHPVYTPPTPNMKYKARDRYNFGWNDPRTLRFAERFEDIPTIVMGHYSRSMTTDQLKAAWLLEYGDRPISFLELKRRWATDETGDMMRIAQELHARGMLLSQHDFSHISEIYVLKEKLDASS